MNLVELISALRTAGFSVEAEELADILWLANQLPMPEQASPQDSAKEQIPPVDGRQAAGRKLDDSPPPPPLPPAPEPSTRSKESPTPAGVYLPSGADRKDGLSFRSAGVSALPDKLSYARALRPLLRRVPSVHHSELDEEATVHRIADTQEWLPVMRPTLSHWLELDIVVDEWSSMVLWRESIHELIILLTNLGAFRSVQVWSLWTAQDGKTVELHSGWGSTAQKGPARAPKELISVRGNRLVLLLSDVVSPAWYNGTVAQLLRQWIHSEIVMLFHLLPYQYWQRTGLINAIPAYFRSSSPGRPNAQLTAMPAEAGRKKLPKSGFLPLPTLPFDAHLVANWAQAIAGRNNLWMPGVLLPLDDSHEQTRQAQIKAKRDLNPPPAAMDEYTAAMTMVERFRSAASLEAWKLAGYFSATVPLSLPLMRLVQRVMLPKASREHLAEFYLSGLIRREKGGTFVNDEEARYVFAPGVRRVLFSSITRSEAAEVIRRTSRFISRESGKVIDFNALLADPALAAQIDPGSMPFAELSQSLLRVLGGEYAVLADALSGKFVMVEVEEVQTNLIPNVNHADLPIIENDQQSGGNRNGEAVVIQKVTSWREELEQLVGLVSVKSQIFELEASIKYQMEHSSSNVDLLHNMVFIGNPGSGKTTVARLIAKMYYELGLLKKGHMVEVIHADLVGTFVGQTSHRTNNVINYALDGVLFVDEAYSLGADGFGLEALDTLIHRMEMDRTRLLIIFSGYPEEMEKFLEANPGFASRIPFRITFPDYTPDELFKILQGFLENHGLTAMSNAFKLDIQQVIEGLYNGRDRETFSNARLMDELSRSLVKMYTTRCEKENIPIPLTPLEPEDIPLYYRFNVQKFPPQNKNVDDISVLRNEFEQIVQYLSITVLSDISINIIFETEDLLNKMFFWIGNTLKSNDALYLQKSIDDVLPKVHALSKKAKTKMDMRSTKNFFGELINLRRELKELLVKIDHKLGSLPKNTDFADQKFVTDKNPFIIAGPVHSNSFIGRSQEINRIFSSLERQGRSNFSITGHRRSGKTSLLLHIIEVYPDRLNEPQNYRFIYIDAQRGFESEESLLSTILEDLELIDISTLTEERQTKITLSFFAQKIDELHNKQGVLPVLCLDEFEYLVQQTEIFSQNLFGMWRSLAINGKLSFIVATATPLYEVFSEAGFNSLFSPFYNIFEQIRVDDFTELESRELLSINTDNPFTEKEIRRLFELAGYRPNNLQIAAMLLYNAKTNHPVNWKKIVRDYGDQITYSGNETTTSSSKSSLSSKTLKK